ncbi:hypothetical protein [Kitasatospora purpeofusca]|uniref:hypothetical protein n=1 Tax=Kitasatospora purpeofusca TaxID=67352 RepID=UPI0035DA328A
MQAAAFLRHTAEQYADQLGDLFEVLLGTGMRRGEVLALHWSDVHLMDRKLFVRRTLSAVDNGEDIPIAIVTKTLRHATLATTINLYGHLFKDSADQAVGRGPR